MYEIAQQEDIIVEFFNFAQPLEGIYIVNSDLPIVIGLNSSLKNNTPLLRSVMAEELGHHFTSVGSCVPQQFYNYNYRCRINKCEYKALKWAALYLIPLNKLLNAIKCGISTIWELAEFFNVTDEMVNFRLKLPDIKIFSY